MRFLDVNNEEFRAILVGVVELFEGTKLVPERGSGVAAKDQHHRPLAAKAGEPDSTAVHAFQFEIGCWVPDA